MHKLVYIKIYIHNILINKLCLKLIFFDVQYKRIVLVNGVYITFAH